MAMKNPPLRHCIEPLGLSITQAAAALGVTRTTLSELVNEKRGIWNLLEGLLCETAWQIYLDACIRN